LVDAGMPNNIKMTCYQIPAELLEPEKTTIYFSGDIPRNRMKLRNFSDYVPGKIIKYSHIPKETKEYYKESYRKNKRPLVFNKIPIFYIKVLFLLKILLLLRFRHVEIWL
jgi:hypothetical protein